nr:nuclear factor erythroid 2-related factor 3 [Zootoca vivipara]XP_034985481.1 nuclear factor erythroid 2-related factor 3 [Zootoca vivipara]XP_034985482.1 nuclear factor erythroid 2-related factor 3 [Zootoca vivipara]XP_034985483.1 nuclear factor erythroid 2-related factor 3 [Zootoca vivipara]XP_034985484.1 nuclear factor erythroid 2-related factor 3 [Zootoca vivipara]
MEDEDSESQEEEEGKESDKSDQVDWREKQSPVSSSSEPWLGNTVPVINSRGMNLPNFHNTVNLTQAISRDVSLHDATMVKSDHNTTVNAERRNLEILENLSLTDSHTSLMNGVNMLGVFASDNCTNLTSQDLFLSLDGHGFEASCFFEERDSDSGLSLDLNHSNSSLVFTCDSDAESATYDLAVGGCCVEYSKCYHTDYQSNYDLSAELFVDVLHDHTYSQIPQQLVPCVPEEYDYMWPEKSNKARSRNGDNAERNQSRDEYRAEALRIPFSVNDIVTLPVDSFNSLLSKYYLTDNQLSLIRDIRRRGKNKVAAQNCRKRKLDAIMNLEDQVCHLQAQKEKLKKEKAQCNRSISNIKQKLNDLYWDILSRLRDDQGRPVNPSQYSLQCCKNGSVLVVPGKAIKLELKQNNPTKKVAR